MDKYATFACICDTTAQTKTILKGKKIFCLYNTTYNSQDIDFNLVKKEKLSAIKEIFLHNTCNALN